MSTDERATLVSSATRSLVPADPVPYLKDELPERHNLPLELTSFIGRERERLEIARPLGTGLSPGVPRSLVRPSGRSPLQRYSVLPRSFMRSWAGNQTLWAWTQTRAMPIISNHCTTIRWLAGVD